MIAFLQSVETDFSVTKLDQLIERLFEMGVSAGKHIIAALLVLMIGRLLVKFLNHLVAKMLDRRRIDVGVQSFLRSAVNILLITLLIISIIGALGVNTTSFAALLASAGVAIGMALSGNLQNIAGGIIVLVFKPYRVGDWIESQGVSGNVEEIQIFHTILRTADNQIVYVPNGAMSTAVVVNYSREPIRRLQWTVGIDYGEDVGRVKAVVEEVLKSDERILLNPAPYIGVDALADSSVNVLIRVWTKQEEYWNVRYEVHQKIYEAFNAAGIDFPFPQQTVHFGKMDNFPFSEVQNPASGQQRRKKK